MSDKKKFLLNCEVCDARKIKEEDYNCYEKMKINTEFVIVSERSKSVLNKLPVTINQEDTIVLPEDVDMEIKTVNGNYEITGNAIVQEHALMVVNGSLFIHPKTEEVLSKYGKIIVNGNVRCTASLERYLTKCTINGSVIIYPDDCVVLDRVFQMDKYFPLRAKAENRYFVEDMVVIGEENIDVAKLVDKKVEFVAKRLLVSENKVEECIPMFDEKVEFIVVPDGMKIIYGDVVLDEHLVKKEGSRLYIYGNVELEPECDMAVLEKSLEKLIVKGDITLKKAQEEIFGKLDAEYDKLIFNWEGRLFENKGSVLVDKSLLENSPKGVRIQNVATVNIAEDVNQELILDKLQIKNCATVFCGKQQESAIGAVSQNVARVAVSQNVAKVEEKEEENNSFKEMPMVKVINAETYVM